MIDGYKLTKDGQVVREVDGEVLAVLYGLDRDAQKAEAVRVAAADLHAQVDAA